MRRHGQAALEYLFTYGWAFLAIIITIGALAYFGIFDFTSLRGTECTFPPGVVCNDYYIGDELSMCGDVNMDGVVDNNDRDLVDEVLGPTYDFTHEQFIIADVNEDGSITNADRGMIGGGPPFPGDPACEAPVAKVSLMNVFGADLNITYVNASDARGRFYHCAPEAGPLTPSYEYDNWLWEQDTVMNISCSFVEDTYADGQAYDITVTMNFTQVGHDYEHSIKGWILGSAQ